METTVMDIVANLGLGRHGWGCGSGRFCLGEGGHLVGQSNYSISKFLQVLESAHNILPISGAEWDLLSSCHAVYHPGWTLR